METWTLDHPTLGRLSATAGWPDELRQSDAGFTPETDESLAAMQEKGRGRLLESGVAEPSPRKEWLRQRLNRDEAWHRQGLVLERDGVVFARVKSIADLKIRLARTTPDGHFTEHTSTTSRPRIEVTADPLRRHIVDVLLRTDDEVVAFDPPPGSPGARRRAAMDESPWKRIVYPLLGGLSKGGWALAMLFVVPVVTRIIGAFVSWILSFFPPIHLPSIPWPTIHWPSIPWPHIPLPHIDLPSIPWPHVDLPDWLDWLLEHPKVWTPVLLAVFWGIAASRNHKKSQAKKAEWELRRERTRLATALRALERDRRDGV